MSRNAIYLSDKALKKLELLADKLGILREIDITNPDDTHDWFVEILCKLANEKVMMEEAHRFHRRTNYSVVS